MLGADHGAITIHGCPQPIAEHPISGDDELIGCLMRG
jgi:hypothetical protein